jgi:hypothetical protein
MEGMKELTIDEIKPFGRYYEKINSNLPPVQIGPNPLIETIGCTSTESLSHQRDEPYVETTSMTPTILATSIEQQQSPSYSHSHPSQVQRTPSKNSHTTPNVVHVTVDNEIRNTTESLKVEMDALSSVTTNRSEVIKFSGDGPASENQESRTNCNDSASEEYVLVPNAVSFRLLIPFLVHFILTFLKKGNRYF